MVKLEYELDWKKEYEESLLRIMTLERERANLWGVNEDLRNKISALEKGQEDLQEELAHYKLNWFRRLFQWPRRRIRTDP